MALAASGVTGEALEGWRSVLDPHSLLRHLGPRSDAKEHAAAADNVRRPVQAGPLLVLKRKLVRMKTRFIAIAILMACPGIAIGANPPFVEQDTTGVYEALHDMAYRRLIEINIAALGTRKVTYAEDDQAYLGQALACVADPHNGDIYPVDLVEDMTARFGPVCDAQGGRVIVAPYEPGSSRTGIATDISWAEWSDPNKPAEGAWGGELYCGVGDTPKFKVRAVSALRRIGCLGRSAVELVVPKPGSSSLQSEWQEAVRYDMAKREEHARSAEAERTEAARAAAALREERDRGRAAMGNVARGTKICSDNLMGRNAVLYGYVEDVVGSRVKVLILGNSSGTYMNGRDPKPQEIHWYSRSDWRVCE